MANAYKQAGVDIEAGYEAVSRMKTRTNNYEKRSTRRFRRFWRYV